ncbi:hypothetical protein GCM10011340_35890 [Roseivirga thermotolerans]|uniref:RHS repeat-associated core domain-containing protein n=1 Tax=Roseivirga thermotolerans TaxID=1758176 RepID=A0ABQ3ICQ2_9BACT|nr:hypothetical protein GCM10011340_35890 [Roseivirga thermotolerans]
MYFDDLRITHTKGQILQEDHYYPFGATISALSSSAPLSKPNRYKLSGNEEQVDFDWNVYDFNARIYDPQLGLFLHTDPLADVQESWTPYHYNYGNPMRFIDPTGLYSTEEWKKDNGISDDDMVTVYEASENENEPDDWIKNLLSGEYVWDNSVKGDGDTPDGFKYIGKSIRDVKNDFDEGTSWFNFWSKPNINSKGWPGEILPEQRNAAGRLKDEIEGSPMIIRVAGGALYDVADNFYISFLQLGGNRYSLEGYGMSNNEVTDAGVNTFVTAIPYSRAARVEKLNAASFSSMLKGTILNKWLYRTGNNIRGKVNQAFNYVYSRQIDYSIKVVVGATGANN